MSEGDGKPMMILVPVPTPKMEAKQKRRSAAGVAPKDYQLPTFTYYVPESAARIFEPSDEVCDCCKKKRGYIYTGPFYHPAPRDADDLCAVCIEDGTAAERYDGSFNDIIVHWENEDGTTVVVDEEAAKAPEPIIDELLHRTPGYETWQSNPWMFHCGDGGVFQGDATAEAVANASPAAKAHWEAKNQHTSWEETMTDYQPGTGLSVYHFKCRQCGLDLFHWDFD